MIKKRRKSYWLPQILLAFFCIYSFTSCQLNDKNKMPDLNTLLKDSTQFSDIEWLDSLVDVGNIKTGSKCNITFRFKNAGKKPLYIIQAKPGCGCTVADYPKQAITSGGSGEITAVFDTKNKPADEAFNKNIMVTANTKRSTYYLYFFGKIVNASDSIATKDTTRVAQKMKKKINKKDLILIPIKK